MSLSKMLKNELRRDSLLITPDFDQFLAKHPELIFPDEIADWMRGQLVEVPRNRTKSWSASSMGRCHREQVFQHEGVKRKKEINTGKTMIFHDGHFRHIKWQGLLFWAGMLDEAEVPITIPEFNVRGTMDGVCTHAQRGKHGLEIKGANSRSYKYIIENGPKYEHLLQIHAYMIGSGLDLWSLIYENKDTNEWKEFVVEQDDEITGKVIHELNELTTSLLYEVLPDPLDECIEKRGRYRSCAYRHKCLKIQDFEEIKTKTVTLRRMK